MAYNKKNYRSSSKTTTVPCSCGGQAKLTSKKNYTHGKKSTSLTSWFYKCKTCKKITYNKQEGGKYEPRRK